MKDTKNTKRAKVGQVFKFVNGKYNYIFKIASVNETGYTMIVDDQLFNISEDELLKAEKL